MALTVVVMVVACGRGALASTAPAVAPSTVPPVDAAPGTVLAAQTLTGVGQTVLSVTGWSERITYASKSGVDDQPSRVTGSVFVPKGQAPQGGWPLVGFAPSDAGRSPKCAASLSATLLNGATTVESLVDAGYVVAVPDYQGLGLFGPEATYHPYLDSTTAAFNLIDAVRAARQLVPNTSTRWLAFGAAQGGQAAWAADETAANYGGGLELVGSVSLTPTADVDGLADAAAQGSLTAQQKMALANYEGALHDEYGADFPLDHYRRGITRATLDALADCATPAARREQAADTITTDDLRPNSSAATAVLRSFLQKTSLPQAPGAAPMLVIYGGSDPLIPGSWTDDALARACGMGDLITIERQPTLTGDQIEPSMAFAWLGQRFAEQSVVDDCRTTDTGQDSASMTPGVTP
jgi:hypothetical protein